MISLKGFPTTWESLIQGVSVHPSLTKVDQLKNECTQEESQLITRGIIHNKEEGIQALHANSNNKRKRHFKKREKIKTIRKEICQKFNATNVTNLDILTCTVQKDRKSLSTYLKSRNLKTHYSSLPYQVG